jgi:hypothetical protein
LPGTPGGSQYDMHPGRGARRVRGPVFPAPLPGCDFVGDLFRGLARKQPWPTPGYYPPTPSGVGRPSVFGCSSASNWLLVSLTWSFLSVPPCLRERMAVWLFGCSSASPRSLRLREKAVGDFFGSGSAELWSSALLCVLCGTIWLLAVSLVLAPLSYRTIWFLHRLPHGDFVAFEESSAPDTFAPDFFW